MRVPIGGFHVILWRTLWLFRSVGMSLDALMLGQFGDRRLDKRGRRCSAAWSWDRRHACVGSVAGSGAIKSALGAFWRTAG